MPDYRLDPPDFGDNDEADPSCSECFGFGRVTEEDEDGKHSVECDCVERGRERAE
jgi:hypothetical protein